jgi:hypothetical protein
VGLHVGNVVAETTMERWLSEMMVVFALTGRERCSRASVASVELMVKDCTNRVETGTIK